MSENHSKFHYHERREQDFSVTVKPQFLQVLLCFHFFFLITQKVPIDFTFLLRAPVLNTFTNTVCFSGWKLQWLLSPPAQQVPNNRGLCANVCFRLSSGNTNPLSLLATCHVPRAYLGASLYFLVQNTNLSLGVWDNLLWLEDVLEESGRHSVKCWGTLSASRNSYGRASLFSLLPNTYLEQSLLLQPFLVL